MTDRESGSDDRGAIGASEGGEVTRRDASTTARLCLALGRPFFARVESRSILARNSSGAVGDRGGDYPGAGVPPRRARDEAFQIFSTYPAAGDASNELALPALGWRGSPGRDVRNSPRCTPLAQGILMVRRMGPCSLGCRGQEAASGPASSNLDIFCQFCVGFGASGLESAVVFVRGLAICGGFGEDPKGMREGGCGRPMEFASSRGFGGAMRPQRSGRRLDRPIPLSLRILRHPWNRTVRNVFALARPGVPRFGLVDFRISPI